ncbi:AB hydrolase superfamily protein B1A11.02 [Aspergillus awamori]|uniref:AB hydrolase superfamily protein B1A11.02 n=1 Tax=Aspergillus awamori TaxID=105351 RepID=A0A401KYK4_ASPAW|nr:AB hydrolase superfamily protein B1A11.02 [Aspergillus awamori]
MLDQFNTKEDVLKLGVVARELEEILKHSPAPKLDFTSPVEQLRAMVSTMEKTTYDSCPKFDTQETVINIPMRDGYQNELHITKPGNSSSSSGNPVVVLIYGGFFVMGTNIQSIVWARTIAHLYGATVVQPSYRLAPEHKFPAAPNDIWDSVQWIAANEVALDADLSKGFVIVKERLSPPITGVLASIPVCISQETLPEKYKELWVSKEQNANAPWEPGTGFKVAGLDILRDDGIVYAKVLKDNGVEVKLDAYSGMPHGHFNLWPQLKASMKSQQDTIWHFGWLLRRELPRKGWKKLWSK